MDTALSTPRPVQELPVQDMLATDVQFKNELQFSRKHISTYIEDEIRASEDSESKVRDGVRRLRDWLAGDFYESKAERLVQMKPLNLEEVVRTVFCCTAYCQSPELFSSISAQIANKLGFNDKREGILTAAEILTVLANTDAYDLLPGSESNRITVQSQIQLSEQLVQYVRNSRFLPPMVCEPTPLRENYESPYLTHNDSAILGLDNAHAEDICLDVINKQNQVAYKLNVEFLETCAEVPTTKPDTMRKQQLWSEFLKQSREIYRVMLGQGNKFWFSHKVDKRGRLYSQGYHINPQGAPYKKAMLDLHHEELVEGVPND